MKLAWILPVLLTAGIWNTSSLAADITCVSSVSRSELQRLAATLPNDPDDPNISSRPSWGPEFAQAIGRLFPENSYCSSSLIAGELNAGDARRFASFLTNAPFLQRVYLNVGGTALTEAAEMGDVVRQRKLRTIAPLASDSNGGAILVRHNLTKLENLCETAQTCRCDGACVLIWAGGIERTGNALTLGALSGISDGNAAPVSSDRGDPETQVDGRVALFLQHMDVTPALRRRLIDLGGSQRAFPDFLEAANDRFPQEATDVISAFCGFAPTALTLSPDIRAPLQSLIDRQAALRRSASTWRHCSDAVLFHLMISAGPLRLERIPIP